MPAYIHAIGTAVPAYKISQAQSLAFMQKTLQLSTEQTRKLRILYQMGRIQERYSVVEDFIKEQDFEFYKEIFPSTAQRMARYQQEALALALKAIAKIPISLQNITHLITFSCTGMYAAGLDIEIVEKLGLSPQTHRIAINFMGCYAAFNALKTAQAFCETGAKVLLVGVELCTLHLQQSFLEDHILSAALFADGAAAVLMSNEASEHSLKVEHFRCHLLPEGKQDMTWKIADTGFDMRLSAYVPQLLEKNIADFVAHTTRNEDLPQHWAIHPGGRKILEALQNALQLPQQALESSYDILKNYGNMSSVTVLFVLEKIWKKTHKGDKILAMAFGPGLSIETATLGY